MDEEEEEEAEMEVDSDSDSDSNSDSDSDSANSAVWEVIDTVGEGAERVVVRKNRDTGEITTEYDDSIYDLHRTKNNDTFKKLHRLGTVKDLYALNRKRFDSVRKNSQFYADANILYKKKLRQQ